MSASVSVRKHLRREPRIARATTLKVSEHDIGRPMSCSLTFSVVARAILGSRRRCFRTETLALIGLCNERSVYELCAPARGRAFVILSYPRVHIGKAPIKA